MKTSMSRLKAFLVVLWVVLWAGCVPPPPGNTDPVAGEHRWGTSSAVEATTGKRGSLLPPAPGPHLCAKGEDVAFACTIEATDQNRRPLTSVCVSYKTGTPMIVVKEKPEGGRVFSPLEQDSGEKGVEASAVSLLKSTGVTVGFEIRTSRVSYVVLKKGPVEVDGGTLYNGPTTYVRTLTLPQVMAAGEQGVTESTPANEGRCERSDQSSRITDNIEAFMRKVAPQ